MQRDAKNDVVGVKSIHTSIWLPKTESVRAKKEGCGPKELLKYLSIQHLNMRDYPFKNEFQKSSSNKIKKIV